DNLRPYIPRRQSGTPALIWFRGVYTAFTSYNCEIVGLFPNAIPSPPQVSILSPIANPVTFTNLNNQLHFIASASDDGIPGPLNASWSTVSGPTNAIFSNPIGTDTAASFPLPGAYLIRITADDTASSASAELTVNTGPPSTDDPDATRVLWLKLDESS